MDILDLLNNISDFSRTAYGQWIIWVSIIGLIVLYGIGRGVVGAIYYAIFPSKRPSHTKPFEEDVEENRNKPLSSSSSESIGSISTRLGEDVRDVWERGYSNNQIDGVLTGKYALEELYKMEPEGNTISSKGREILDNKERLAN